MSDEETFYSWISRQPSETQNFALGAKSAQLLRDGKLNSKDVQRLQNPQRLSIESFENKAHEIITGRKAK